MSVLKKKVFCNECKYWPMFMSGHKCNKVLERGESILRRNEVYLKAEPRINNEKNACKYYEETFVTKLKDIVVSTIANLRRKNFKSKVVV